MNERINELANECYYFNTCTDLEMFDKEKFAQLIVQECAEFADKGTRGGIGELMKRHFGENL